MAKIHRNDDPYAVQNQRREAAARTQQIQVPAQEPQPPRRSVPPVQGAEPPHPVQDAEQPRQKKKPEPSRGKSGKKKGKSNLVYNIAMIVCLIVFLVSGGILVKRYFDDRLVRPDVWPDTKRYVLPRLYDLDEKLEHGYADHPVCGLFAGRPGGCYFKRECLILVL